MTDSNDIVVTNVGPSYPDAAGSLLNFVAQAVKDPAIDVAKLEALLRMQREIVADDAKAQFNRAFIMMKPELPVIERDGKITYEAKGGKAGAVITHATIENIDEHITPILQRFGFAYSYTNRQTANGLVVVCILRHTAGHSTETEGPPLPCDASGGKNNLQGWGSAQKYGMRYAVVAALNIRVKGKDDDGVRGGMKFITAEQVNEIEKLFTETRTDGDKFLHQFFDVVNLPNLPADNYAPARNMLLAKLKAKA